GDLDEGASFRVKPSTSSPPISVRVLRYVISFVLVLCAFVILGRLADRTLVHFARAGVRGLPALTFLAAAIAVALCDIHEHRLFWFHQSPSISLPWGRCWHHFRLGSIPHCMEYRHRKWLVVALWDSAFF